MSAQSPLNRDLVVRIARLARLELDETEVTRMTDEMGKILAYVDLLTQADTSTVEATSFVHDLTIPLRDDIAEAGTDRQEALQQAPRHVGDGFGVPGFVEELVMQTMKNVNDLAKLVRTGERSAEEIANEALACMEEKNPELGAYLFVAGKSMLEDARAIDAQRARGEKLGPLAGVPIGLKDALCVRGMSTTSASKILVNTEGKPWISPYDATVVARLRSAGALLAGKCNMDEFAMGSSNETSAFFPARNPVDPTRTPGGSSGGSAVSVAAAMTAASLGSDTGGSIRQPAAYTGVVGVKPTYGRVSRYGLVAFASSLDQVGPFASDVRGAARVLSVIAGKDRRDATTVDVPVDDYEASCGRDIKGLTVGVPEEYFTQGLDAAVEQSVRAAIRALEKEGVRIRPVTLPHTAYAVAVYYVLATAEASSNLARFDGVRYGLRRDAPQLDAMYSRTRGEGFGREVRRRIMLGTYVLSAGYYDAYYKKAQKVRTLICQDFERAFADVDVIATPTAPTSAFLLGSQLEDPLTMYLNDSYTLPASLAGVPAISVPARPTPPTANQSVSLPVGLQLISPRWCETRLFQLAHFWESIQSTAGIE